MKSIAANPFNPQFGRRPKQFIGRELIINDFLQSLGIPDDPNRVTIITGIRGSGKTAILSDIQLNLDAKNYLVIDVTAKDGMLLEVLDQCSRKGKQWLGKKLDGLQGVTLGALGFSMGFTVKERTETHGFRYYITDVLDSLKKHGITAVFLVDEVHSDTDEMREFITTYQHLMREEYDIALLMAGLPSSVQAVLNDKVLTFLQRAHRVRLESIDTRIVRMAYENVFTAAKRKFAGAALDLASQAACGYPYLIQLIGFFLWRKDGDTITEKDVAQALLQSKVELFQNVHDIIYRELSAKDREFLEAMLQDEDESAYGDIVQRIGVTSGYASRYRQRLLDAGIIERSAFGKLRIAPPHFKEFLADVG